jgi:hypothetical protein
MRSHRKQAQLLSHWLARERPHLRAVLIGGRREGKSDLLSQTRRLLFDSAEGPLPFWFRFEPRALGDTQEATRTALHFASSFCQQIRAFLLRQEEILSAPPGELADEIQRTGLPLSLHELAQELLVAAGQQHGEGRTTVEIASRLPARFASREGRPVCILWDDCHHLKPQSPFLNELEGRTTTLVGSVCFLVTGMSPPMGELAGRNSWSVVQLSSLPTDEALMVAESLCKESAVRFNRPAWECWFAVSGTSPGWITPIIESAAIGGEPLETIEQIGHVYAEQLERGSIGTWLTSRWPLDTSGSMPPNPSSRDIATGLANKDSRFLASLNIHNPARNTVAEAAKSTDLIGSLEQGEWLRRYALTTEISVSPVETDWLRLEIDRIRMGSARAKARSIQRFLLRAHRVKRYSSPEDSSLEMSPDAIERHLISPVKASAVVSTASGDTLRLPTIYSVVRETTAEGQLFWAFGETQSPQAAKESSSGITGQSGVAPVVLLLVLSELNPTKAMVSGWALRLQQEIRLTTDSQTPLDTDLWVIVPPGASLAPCGVEKRLTLNMLDELLRQTTPGVGTPVSQMLLEASSSPGGFKGEISERLADLHARAQLFQSEIRAADANAPAERITGSVSHREDRRNELLRQALSLSLMLASADLAATGSSTEGAGGTQVELAELQMRCQQLLDELRADPEHPQLPARNGRITKKLPPTD